MSKERIGVATETSWFVDTTNPLHPKYNPISICARQNFIATTTETKIIDDIEAKQIAKDVLIPQMFKKLKIDKGCVFNIGECKRYLITNIYDSKRNSIDPTSEEISKASFQYDEISTPKIVCQKYEKHLEKNIFSFMISHYLIVKDSKGKYISNLRQMTPDEIPNYKQESDRRVKLETIHYTLIDLSLNPSRIKNIKIKSTQFSVGK